MQEAPTAAGDSRRGGDSSSGSQADGGSGSDDGECQQRRGAAASLQEPARKRRRGGELEWTVTQDVIGPSDPLKDEFFAAEQVSELLQQLNGAKLDANLAAEAASIHGGDCWAHGAGRSEARTRKTLFKAAVKVARQRSSARDARVSIMLTVLGDVFIVPNRATDAQLALLAKAVVHVHQNCGDENFVEVAGCKEPHRVRFCPKFKTPLRRVLRDTFFIPELATVPKDRANTIMSLWRTRLLRLAKSDAYSAENDLPHETRLHLLLIYRLQSKLRMSDATPDIAFAEMDEAIMALTDYLESAHRRKFSVLLNAAERMAHGTCFDANAFVQLDVPDLSRQRILMTLSDLCIGLKNCFALKDVVMALAFSAWEAQLRYGGGFAGLGAFVDLVLDARIDASALGGAGEAGTRVEAPALVNVIAMHWNRLALRGEELVSGPGLPAHRAARLVGIFRGLQMWQYQAQDAAAIPWMTKVHAAGAEDKPSARQLLLVRAVLAACGDPGCPTQLAVEGIVLSLEQRRTAARGDGTSGKRPGHGVSAAPARDGRPDPREHLVATRLARGLARARCVLQDWAQGAPTEAGGAGSAAGEDWSLLDPRRTTSVHGANMQGLMVDLCAAFCEAAGYSEAELKAQAEDGGAGDSDALNYGGAGTDVASSGIDPAGLLRVIDVAKTTLSNASDTMGRNQMQVRRHAALAFKALTAVEQDCSAAADAFQASAAAGADVELDGADPGGGVTASHVDLRVLLSSLGTSFTLRNAEAARERHAWARSLARQLQPNQAAACALSRDCGSEVLLEAARIKALEYLRAPGLDPLRFLLARMRSCAQESGATKPADAWTLLLRGLYNALRGLSADELSHMRALVFPEASGPDCVYPDEHAALCGGFVGIGLELDICMEIFKNVSLVSGDRIDALLHLDIWLDGLDAVGVDLDCVRAALQTRAQECGLGVATYVGKLVVQAGRYADDPDCPGAPEPVFEHEHEHERGALPMFLGPEDPTQDSMSVCATVMDTENVHVGAGIHKRFFVAEPSAEAALEAVRIARLPAQSPLFADDIRRAEHLLEKLGGADLSVDPVDREMLTVSGVNWNPACVWMLQLYALPDARPEDPPGPESEADPEGGQIDAARVWRRTLWASYYLTTDDRVGHLRCKASFFLSHYPLLADMVFIAEENRRLLLLHETASLASTILGFGRARVGRKRQGPASGDDRTR